MQRNPIAAASMERKTELDKAIEEIRRGEVIHYDSVDDLINHINSL